MQPLNFRLSTEGAAERIAFTAFSRITLAALLTPLLVQHSSAQGITFSGPQVITTSVDDPYQVIAADLDGDGDQDVVSASRFDDKIAWYENLGGGMFGAQQVITTSADFANTVAASDLDGDGDLDVLCGSRDDDTVAWYENLGSGSFGAEQVINSTTDPISVFAADLDGDGDQDVLYGTVSFGGSITWHANLGGGTFGPAQSVATATSNWVIASDLDGDGDEDIVSAGSDKLAWYENLGGFGFGPEQTLVLLTWGAETVLASDLDGDGDRDVLFATTPAPTGGVPLNSVRWLENLGGGTFAATSQLVGSASGFQELAVADLTGDGDLEIVGAECNGSSLLLYEDLSVLFEQLLLGTCPRTVFTADLDGDGDQDLLYGASNDTVAWFENSQISPPPPPPPPANDTCATPEVISGLGTFPYDRTTATSSGFDGGDGSSICLGTGFDGAGNRDVFFAWSAFIDGDYTFASCSEGADTQMSIHLGADCSATCLASEDGNVQCTGTLVETEVFLTGVLTTETYLIQIGNWSPDSTNAGPGDLEVTAPPPPNNDCGSAIPISGLGTTTFDNQFATTSGFGWGVGPCVGGGPGQVEVDVFYQWTAAASGDRRFSTAGSGIDTVLALHLGTGCAAVCTFYDDDSAGNFESQIDVLGVAAGDTYLVQVGGWGPAQLTAAGVLDISELNPPPTNGTCATPDVALEGTTTWDNSLATTSGFDGGDPAVCMSPVNAPNTILGPAAKDLFWVFTASSAGDYQIDTDGSTGNTDTRLSVHVGSDCSATCLASNDDEAGLSAPFLSLLVVPGVAAGDDYLIQIGSWTETSSAGPGNLNITNLGPSGPTFNILCDPASPHFQGNYAKLDTSSYGSGVGSDLHLECTDGPASEFGFFLMSFDGTANIAAFNGVLCLGSPSGRYNAQIATNQGLPQLNSIGQFDAAGVLQNLVGTGASSGGSGFDVPLELPFSPVGQVINSGDVVYFQLWYRDQVPPLPNPGSSANFSNMLETTFP